MNDNELVNEVVNDRSSVYDDPIVSMSRIALVWSALLDIEIQPWQVPIMLMGLKLVRTSTTPEYSDNSDDIEGYLGIFRKVVGDDMIVARTTQEYLAKTKERTVEKAAEALTPKREPLRCLALHYLPQGGSHDLNAVSVCIKPAGHEGNCAWSLESFILPVAIDLCRQLSHQEDASYWCRDSRHTPHETHTRIIT